jgi:hypothetical protein
VRNGSILTNLILPQELLNNNASMHIQFAIKENIQPPQATNWSTSKKSPFLWKRPNCIKDRFEAECHFSRFNTSSTHSL